MRKLLVLFMLSNLAAAHPLGWLVGTYHGQSEGSQLEETWTEAGQELLGSTIWLEDGRVGLRELFRIRPVASGYHLDLWLTFSDGTGKHLTMEGRPEGMSGLVFEGQRGDRLTYSKRPDGGLRCQLHKQEVTTFEMDAGPRPADQVVLAGNWVLHTYLGEHLFADELRWTSSQGGTITVPGKFSAPIENLKHLPERRVTFEIVVPEGERPYRVSYRMQFEADMKQATGSLVDLSSGQTLGCFVARRKSD
ncbi:MAG: DUF6265 family protein [Vulcanimicrobiota bacterium]